MYVWIDGEQWAADGQPPITESHGLLVGVESWDDPPRRAPVYGFMLSEERNRAIEEELTRRIVQDVLPLGKDQL